MSRYLEYAHDLGATSVVEESSGICIYPMQMQRDSCKKRILEIYASDSAYQQYIKTSHFLHYKNEILPMVKLLDLIDM